MLFSINITKVITSCIVKRSKEYLYKEFYNKCTEREAWMNDIKKTELDMLLEGCTLKQIKTLCIVLLKPPVFQHLYMDQSSNFQNSFPHNHQMQLRNTMNMKDYIVLNLNRYSLERLTMQEVITFVILIDCFSTFVYGSIK